MLSLIEAYRADPTDENAEKIANYDKKHPMARAFLSFPDCEELKKALEHQKRRKKFLQPRPEPLF